MMLERRMCVKGWKGFTKAGGRNEFVSWHSNPPDSFIEYEHNRIGAEGLHDWQPHVTEVIVQQRVVNEWETVVTYIGAPHGTYTFRGTAYLYWKTDETGTVTELCIVSTAHEPVPWDGPGGVDGCIEVRAKAEAKGWQFDALSALPPGVVWEG